MICRGLWLGIVPKELPVRQPLLIALALIALPGADLAFAQSSSPSAASSGGEAPGSARPVNDQKVTAGDVATTPLTDLNIKKNAIPPVLVRAVEDTYGLGGLGTCPRLGQAVRQIDAVLGEDLDVQRARGVALTPGHLAKSLVSSFIPFDGIIREISGARADQARMQLAILAGSERRAFLKGVGLQRGCPYPARPLSAGGSQPSRHR